MSVTSLEFSHPVCVIDWGNTRVKALLRVPQMADQQISGNAEDVLTQLVQWQIIHQALQVVVAQVGMSSEKSFELRQQFPTWIWLDAETPTPFINDYAQPEQLGVDRRVLAAGAVLSFPKQPVLVIDCGSCVTYDEIDARGTYRGGAISPGLRMRYNAMHAYTAKLPLLDPHWTPEFPARNTADNMHRGATAGLVYELEAVMADFASRHTNFIIILTGGDASFLATHVKSPIFVRPNFLLESMLAWHQFLCT